MNLTLTLVTIFILRNSLVKGDAEQNENHKWRGQWIKGSRNFQEDIIKKLKSEDSQVIKNRPGLKPVLYFRKTFFSDKCVKKGTVYITSKGVFKGYLTKSSALSITDLGDELNPGWTNYNKTISYHKFDVTNILNKTNEHVLAAQVAKGWYSGYIGPNKNYSAYGDEVALLYELRIDYFDGTSTIIKSDDTWKVSTGPQVYSDLLHGEMYYENLQINDWLQFRFNDSSWSSVEAYQTDDNIEFVELTPYSTITRLPRAGCKHVWNVANKTYVYEMNALVTGFVRLKLTGYSHNMRIKVRFAEAVYANGSIYTDNHGSALVEDVFELNDGKNRLNTYYLQTSFTTHSFQYIEVSGHPEKFSIEDVDGFPLSHNVMRMKISSDNKELENLGSMIQNTQIANLVSVPTNNPSKDSRLGRLDTAGLFSLTAMYNGFVEEFYMKFLKDARDAQAPSGAFPNVAPRAVDYSEASPVGGSSPFIITYNLYRMYGRTKAIEENYEALQKYIDYVLFSNPDFIFSRNMGNDPGDYANVNAETPKEVIATAFLAYDADIMSKLASAVGKNTDADKYSQLYKNVSEAFVKAFVGSDGKVKGDTQTAYVLPLAFKLLPDYLVPKALEYLVHDIKAKNYHLSTGYVGTSFILPVLSDHGYNDIAYKLVLQTSYPSWVYMSDFNTPNLWERWNSLLEFKDVSYNSIGLGSVGAWIFKYMGGIDTDEHAVGFQKIIIKPYIGREVNRMHTLFACRNGTLAVQWTVVGNLFEIKVNLGYITTAKIILPFMTPVWEKEVSGIGNYEFKIPLKSKPV